MNYKHLCDLQILVIFTYILPLLELIHSLIKFAQMKNVFMCNLVVVIKVCQGDVYNMYCVLPGSLQITFGHSNHCWNFNTITSKCGGSLT